MGFPRLLPASEVVTASPKEARTWTDARTQAHTHSYTRAHLLLDLSDVVKREVNKARKEKNHFPHSRCD